jgi:hypothetical protein
MGDRAVDGVESVAKADPERPDLVLMDIQLPVLDGCVTARQIKALPDFSRQSQIRTSIPPPRIGAVMPGAEKPRWGPSDYCQRFIGSSVLPNLCRGRLKPWDRPPGSGQSQDEIRTPKDRSAKGGPSHGIDPFRPTSHSERDQSSIDGSWDEQLLRISVLASVLLIAGELHSAMAQSDNASSGSSARAAGAAAIRVILGRQTDAWNWHDMEAFVADHDD